MDNQYDSILKEKKKYDIPEKPQQKSKFKKYFFFDLIIITIILIIGYIQYYNNILSPKNIIMNNNKIIITEYQDFFKYLNIDNLLSDGTLEGSIKLNNHNYKFNISKKNDTISINLEDDNKEKINYYYSNNGIYYQIPSIKESYIKINNQNKYQGLYKENIIDGISQKIDNKKESKKLYLNNNNPTVEMNMNLIKEEIKSIIPYLFKDNYELIITTKNGAILNNIISEKIVVNNQSKNIRTVYQYEKGAITCVNNSGKTTKFEINKKEKILNVYHKDKLYSIIKYTKENNKHIYTYQIIDEYYSLSLSVENEANHYIYEFTSNIKENNENDNVTIEVDKSTSNNIDNINSQISNEEIKDIDNYKQKETEITKPLRDFINKYKESINYINNY